ncbi:MAG: DUF4440 domain-containing protein [Acidobacteria bacterium]|nr:DUF4440 domain-containing protein [Acidobacteriota bacterium]
MKQLLFAVTLLAVLGAAVTLRPAGALADIDALMKTDQAFSEATATRGLEGFRSFLAEDVATLRPDKPIITGQDAVAEVWRSLLASPTLAIRWQPLRAAISSGGDLGYTIGSFEITRSDEQGKRVAGTGKYVTIWRKQPDGSWRVVFDSGVPDTPPQPMSKPGA